MSLGAIQPAQEALAFAFAAPCTDLKPLLPCLCSLPSLLGFAEGWSSCKGDPGRRKSTCKGPEAGGTSVTRVTVGGSGKDDLEGMDEWVRAEIWLMVESGKLSCIF